MLRDFPPSVWTAILSAAPSLYTLNCACQVSSGAYTAFKANAKAITTAVTRRLLGPAYPQFLMLNHFSLALDATNGCDMWEIIKDTTEANIELPEQVDWNLLTSIDAMEQLMITPLERFFSIRYKDATVPSSSLTPSESAHFRRALLRSLLLRDAKFVRDMVCQRPPSEATHRVERGADYLFKQTMSLMKGHDMELEYYIWMSWDFLNDLDNWLANIYGYVNDDKHCTVMPTSMDMKNVLEGLSLVDHHDIKKLTSAMEPCPYETIVGLGSELLGEVKCPVESEQPPCMCKVCGYGREKSQSGCDDASEGEDCEDSNGDDDSSEGEDDEGHVRVYNLQNWWMLYGDLSWHEFARLMFPGRLKENVLYWPIISEWLKAPFDLLSALKEIQALGALYNRLGCNEEDWLCIDCLKDIVRQFGMVSWMLSEHLAGDCLPQQDCSAGCGCVLQSNLEHVTQFNHATWSIRDLSNAANLLSADEGRKNFS